MMSAFQAWPFRPGLSGRRSLPIEGPPRPPPNSPPLVEGTESLEPRAALSRASVRSSDDGREAAVAFFNFETESKRTIPGLTLPLSELPRPGFAMSPDGSTFIFTRLEATDSDRMWVDGF